MFMRANFADIYLWGMHDKSNTIRSATELVQEIQPGSIQFVSCMLRENLSNQSSEVQIPCYICTRFGRYLYSTKCSWIINMSY